MGYPWFVLHDWAPFHIDALGLVTFLGSDEINLYIGRLVQSRWLEYMPLLGAFVIAGDRFKEKKPSFNIYNISDGVTTSDLSSWFTRWIIAQDFEVTRSVVYWEIIDDLRIWWPYHLIAGAISFSLMGLLVILTVLSKDWYGFTNTVAMFISIVVRAYSLQANRNAINTAVLDSKPVFGTLEYAMNKWEENGRDNRPSEPKPNADARPNGKPWKTDPSKTIIVTSESKAVTMFIPEKLIKPVFVTNPQPRTKWLYESLRWVGWAAFAVHIITIGLAELAAQIYTIALLVIPTVLICWKVGCDDSKLYRGWMTLSSDDIEAPYECWIGSHLKATVFQWPKDIEFKEQKESHVWELHCPKTVKERSTRRQDLYAWLNLTSNEEDSMGKWDLLPHKRNDDDTWTNEFNAKKELIRKRKLDIGAIKLDVTRNIKKETLKKLCGGKQTLDDVEFSNQVTPQHVNPLKPASDQRFKTQLSASGMPTSSASMSLEE